MYRLNKTMYYTAAVGSMDYITNHQWEYIDHIISQHITALLWQVAACIAAQAANTWTMIGIYIIRILPHSVIHLRIFDLNITPGLT